MDLNLSSSLSLREILSITLSAFAESLLLSLSPTWMPVSFPSCLLPNSEGLKGVPLLLPGEWMCLKVLCPQNFITNLCSVLWCVALCCFPSGAARPSFTAPLRHLVSGLGIGGQGREW